MALHAICYTPAKLLDAAACPYRSPLLISPRRLTPSAGTPSPLPSTAPPSASLRRSRPIVLRAMAKTGEPVVEEKLGVRIERNPPEARLADLGVRSWPKWGCPPSKFPWTYSGTETCYLLKGKVKVYAENSTDYVEIGAGDLVVFPNGMSCTWEVFEEVDKHYSFS